MSFFSGLLSPKKPTTPELHPEAHPVDFQADLPPGSPLASDGERRTPAQMAWELLKVVVVSLAIVIPIRYFIFQPFSVLGQSMEPNFNNKDYLIIDEISFRFRAPERGEVLVFKYPYDTKEYYIKRLIGLPGERVKISDNTITIFNAANPDGFKLSEPYLAEGTRTIVFDNIYDVTLKANEYFLLGDNRENSSDSRIFGPVDKSYLIGRVWLRGWPVSRLQLYNHPVSY